MESEAAISALATPGFAPVVAVADSPLRGAVSPALGALLGFSAEYESDDPALQEFSRVCLGPVSSLFRALYTKHLPTAMHCLRVSLGCSAFVRQLQLDAGTRSRIEVAALLHDIGKIGVPDHILNKPSRLDSDEMSVVDRHRACGLQILAGCCADQQVLDIVAHAADRYDGTRPGESTLKGDAIPFGARVVAILDAFDAMTTDLVYRRALTPEQAFAEIRKSASSQFDPGLAESFCAAYARGDAQSHGAIARRWVEDAMDVAGGLWSLQSPLVDSPASAQDVFQRSLLDAMHDGVVFVDLSGRILVWNRGAQRLTGLSAESVRHKSWHPRIVDMRDMEGNAIKTTSCPLTQCLRTFASGMYRMTISGDNGPVAVDIHVTPVHDVGGNCHGATLLLHDVSPEQSLEQRVQNLHQRATLDPLTQVGNRAEFDRRHREMVREHLESERPFSLIICDIDHFKSINDRYGHQAGDESLKQFANLIASHSRGDDLVARYGGEEFVVLCPDCDNDAALRKAEGMRLELAKTPQESLHGNRMTASFGVTELQDGDSTETMLRRADRALYQAKEAGRDRVVQLGASAPAEKPEKRSSWFSWGNTPEEHVLRRRLRTRVPMDIAAEKVRGFISDNDAEIIEIRERFITLSVDERYLPLQRRQTDRPTSLMIELELEVGETGDVGPTSTLVTVTIRPKRSRDRRRDVVSRAEQLLNSLKSYLIAEEY